MENLIFEKAVDIAREYPYLCVYFEGEKDPFIEIEITDRRELNFIFYPADKIIKIINNFFNKILIEAKKFYDHEIKEGEIYSNIFGDD